jgi:hypothetical protein
MFGSARRRIEINYEGEVIFLAECRSEMDGVRTFPNSTLLITYRDANSGSNLSHNDLHLLFLRKIFTG